MKARFALATALLVAVGAPGSNSLSAPCFQFAMELGGGQFRSYTVTVTGGPLPPGLTPERIAEAIFRYHDGSGVPVPSSLEVSPVAQVAQALVGPPEGRPAGVVTGDANHKTIETAVERYMAAGLPIEGVTFWGGARQYGTGSNLGVDAADMLALLRYEAMHRAVKAAGHAPGVKVQLVFEDLGRRFMGDDTQDMRNRVQQYQSEMEGLVKATSTCVTFTPESKIIAQNDVPAKVRALLGLDPTVPMKGSDELFFRVAKKSEDIIFDYLRRTEKADAKAPVDADDQAGFRRVAGLPEFRALEELGFKGGLPLAQRESVRKRTLLRLGNPQLSEEQLDRHVAKYFAQGFARAVFNLRVGTSVPPGGTAPLDTLSYSFLPYPPGTPESMIVRRVELTAVADTGGDRVVPCWGGCAVIDPRGRIQLRAQVRRPEQVVTVTVEGPGGTRVQLPLHVEPEEHRK